MDRIGSRLDESVKPNHYLTGQIELCLLGVNRLNNSLWLTYHIFVQSIPFDMPTKLLSYTSIKLITTTLLFYIMNLIYTHYLI